MAGSGQQRSQELSFGFVQSIFVRPNAKSHKELLDALGLRWVLTVHSSRVDTRYDEEGSHYTD
jgi:hypothetical protein